MIKLHFETLDGIRKTKRFKTLAGARKAAHEWVGKDATVGRWYAVSFDGVVKVMCEGCTVHDIWPDGDYGDELDVAHKKATDELDAAYAKAVAATGADAEAANNEYLWLKSKYEFEWKKKEN